MGILLLLLGLLAVGSGAVKLRARTRARLVTSSIAKGELIAGAALVLGSGLGLARQRPLAWIAVGVAVALVLVSSAVHLRKAMDYRRRRAASEGERLTWHVRAGTSRN